MSFENLVPGLAQMREREIRNRSLAFAGLTPRLCGEEVVAFTPALRLKLQLIRSAFLYPDVEPLAGDVFHFLRTVAAREPRGLRRWLLRRRVAKMNLARSVREIRIYIGTALQDSPEDRGGSGSDLSAYVHWMASEASFWMEVHGGFTFEGYARTPYLVLQQLRRAWQCNHPEVTYHRDGSVTVHEPMFINSSDRLIGQWHRQHREAVAERIKAQREKRN